MKYSVDTSVVLRVLTGMPESLATAVRARLEGLWIDGIVVDVCDLVVSETYFALQHSYGLSKENALDALTKLSLHPGFHISDNVTTALRTPNLAKASPGFIDRVIHRTCVADDEATMLTCEKDAKRLAHVEVIRERFKHGDKQ